MTIEDLRRRLAVGGVLRPPVGIGVGRRQVVAVTVDHRLAGPSPDRVLRRELAAGPSAQEWPELERALAELRTRLGRDGPERRPGEGLRVHLALLPPLARTKGVRLPAAGRKELRRLVAREASRHFLPAPDDPVADARLVGPGSGDGPAPAVAACAEQSVTGSVLEAAQSAGLEVGLLAPGAYAAAEGARVQDGTLREGTWTLELRADGWSRDLRLEGGRLRGVTAAGGDRREEGDRGTGGGDDDGDPRSRAGTGDAGTPPPTAVGEDAPEAEEPAPATRRVSARGDGGTSDGLGPSALAAYGALVQPEDGLLLLPGPARERWTRRLRTRAASLAAAALVILAGAAGVHLWGVEREIGAVERVRSAIAGEVARASTAREAAERMGALLADLRGLAPDRPGWPEVVAGLSRALPASSYLEELSVTDRGLMLSGAARSPASLVARLEGSPLFRNPRLESVDRAPGSAEPDDFRIVVELQVTAPGEKADASVGEPGPAAAGRPTAERQRP